MIVLDTNILLAFLSRDEKSRRKVLTQWAKLGRETLHLTMPVISEATNFLTRGYEFAALVDLCQRMGMHFLPTDHLVSWQDVIRWMERYANSEPDFTDAYLVILSSIEPRMRVWTNDSEFLTVWRRPDGSAVPLAVR